VDPADVALLADDATAVDTNSDLARVRVAVG
jgi:hypothetical protein